MRPASSCILFDLDGTLLDTAPDMAGALNQLLAERGQQALTSDAIRPHVSHGAAALVRLGFGLAPEDFGFNELRDRFLSIYASRIAQDTRLFPGMEDLLRRIETHAVPWGVVTNKPAWLTEPLMGALALDARAAAVVSGDSATRNKPHPDTLLLACERIGVAPEGCLYVGDAERDIEAGRRAGMRTLAAGFGYISDRDQPGLWGADGVVWHAGDIVQWL
jgi:phosphoglycolate phosphatase